VVKVLIYILMLFIFSTPVLIRHLWQLKTFIFLHWSLMCAVLLTMPYRIFHMRARNLINMEVGINPQNVALHSQTLVIWTWSSTC